MFNNGSTSLKYYKRLGIYKNSTGTVQFNPKTLEGYSYNWKFVAPLKGRVVFNEYHWSSTTSSHQSAVRSVLRELSIKAVFADLGTTSPSNLCRSTMHNLYKDLVQAEVEVELSKRKDTWTYKSRVRTCSDIANTIGKLESIDKQLKLSNKVKNEIRNEVYEKTMEELFDKKSIRGFKEMSLNTAASDFSEVEL